MIDQSSTTKRYYSSASPVPITTTISPHLNLQFRGMDYVLNGQSGVSPQVAAIETLKEENIMQPIQLSFLEDVLPQEPPLTSVVIVDEASSIPLGGWEAAKETLEKAASNRLDQGEHNRAVLVTSPSVKPTLEPPSIWGTFLTADALPRIRFPQ